MTTTIEAAPGQQFMGLEEDIHAELYASDDGFGGSEPTDPIEILVVGAGENTDHMKEPLGYLDKNGHPVYVAEVTTPKIDVNPENLFLVNTEEGRRALEQRIKLGIHAVYISVVPSLHLEMLLKYIAHAGKGEVNMVVTAKPAVKDRAEGRIIQAALKAAHEARRALYGEDYDPEENPILYIHEHYLKKGAWQEVIAKFGELTKELGLLSEATVTIAEQRTAEEEGRTKAFAGGAIEDLGPHVISLGLDVQEAINRNSNGKYAVIDRSETDLRRYRYANSVLPETVETSFVIDGKTQIREAQDDGTNVMHDLKYTWRGGKGLVDKKEAILTFTHPETGVKTTIRIDLKKNVIELPEDAPESVKALFPETHFKDNGYGDSVAMGLNGGDPTEGFQEWEQALMVTNIGDTYQRMADRNRIPVPHKPLQSLEQLEYATA